MKYILIATGILAIAFTGCRRSDIRDFTINIPEMRTEADARIIQGTLVKTHGVLPESIKFDLPKRTVSVKYDSMRVAQKNMEVSISKVGYSANSIPANLKAATKRKSLKGFTITIPELQARPTMANHLFKQMVQWQEIEVNSIRINPTTGLVEVQADANSVTLQVLEERMIALGFTANGRPGDKAAQMRWPSR